jgi:L-lactate dehydrogenase complex protein LldG
MGTRETILQAVAANKPDLRDLPDMDFSMTIQYPDLTQQFIQMIHAAGGQTYFKNAYQELQNDLASVKADGKFIINLLEKPHSQDWAVLNASELETLDTCYLRAELAVAENGAMWISEKQMANRLIPFICQHLVIVLSPAIIVNNMHEAYQQIDVTAEGFGVFIAGPSKTADIEQNLVIGAHGARSLRVYVIESEI